MCNMQKWNTRSDTSDMLIRSEHLRLLCSRNCYYLWLRIKVECSIVHTNLKLQEARSWMDLWLHFVFDLRLGSYEEAFQSSLDVAFDFSFVRFRCACDSNQSIVCANLVCNWNNFWSSAFAFCVRRLMTTSFKHSLHDFIAWTRFQSSICFFVRSFVRSLSIFTNWYCVSSRNLRIYSEYEWILLTEVLHFCNTRKITKKQNTHTHTSQIQS